MYAKILKSVELEATTMSDMEAMLPKSSQAHAMIMRL